MSDPIPEALRQRRQWVLWRDEDGRKVPYRIDGRPADSTDPATWTTYEIARSVERTGRYSGIGYVFAPDDPFAGIDLDDCIVDGPLAGWAQTIVEEAQSYAEVSPSGHGVKLWVEGSLPHNVKTKQIELYDHARYFTVTGQRLPDAPPTIAPAQRTLDRLYRQLRPAESNAPMLPLPRVPDASYLRDWAARLIAQEVARVMQAAEGEKHNVRLAAGRLLGGLIPHGLATAGELEALLLAANRPKAAAHHNERQAIRDGIAYGQQAPLPLPEPPPQPVFDARGFACCPVHDRRLEPAKNGNGYRCPVYDCFWWKGEGYRMPDGVQDEKRVSKGEEAVEPSFDWKERGISAAELQARIFAQLNWPVANILSEGCTLLAGKPKSKKSWLALGLAIHVAYGTAALGMDTQRGTVLYLDLESNQRRMQSRLRAMLGNQPWPPNVHIFTEWPRGEDGIAQLDLWMLLHPDTILVIGDILKNLRPPRMKGANPYDEDYEAVQPFNAWAERNHLAMLMIHHTRKAKAEDVFDEISGSTGLSAGVASMWVLGRLPNSDESILAIRGRDIVIDDDMALAWDDYTCRFSVSGTATERSIGQERRAVLDAMDEMGASSPKDLAERLGKSVASVKMLLAHLFSDRLVEKVGYGKYVKVLGRQNHGTTAKEAYSADGDYSAYSAYSAYSSDDSADAGSKSNLLLGKSNHLNDEAVTLNQGIPMPQTAPDQGKSNQSNHHMQKHTFSDYDHDKARTQEAHQALARGDISAARRAARHIRANKERTLLEAQIDEASLRAPEQPQSSTDTREEEASA